MRRANKEDRQSSDTGLQRCFRLVATRQHFLHTYFGLSTNGRIWSSWKRFTSHNLPIELFPGDRSCLLIEKPALDVGEDRGNGPRDRDSAHPSPLTKNHMGIA